MHTHTLYRMLNFSENTIGVATTCKVDADLKSDGVSTGHIIWWRARVELCVGEVHLFQ